MTVMALSNRKGGTGKTTTAVNLAACLAELGRSVLLIDLDPQANATTSLGLERAEEGAGAAGLLSGSGAALEDLAEPTPQEGLSAVAASAELASLEFELARGDGWERILAERLADHGRDFIVIDTPPSISALTVNALAAADGVVVPLQCDYLSLEGLREFGNNINRLREQLNPPLRLFALIRTMHDPRTLLTREVDAELERYFGDKVLPTVIPRNVRLAEAPSHGLPVVLHAPGSKGAQAYRAATRELLRVIQ